MHSNTTQSTTIIYMEQEDMLLFCPTCKSSMWLELKPSSGELYQEVHSRDVSTGKTRLSRTS